MGRVFSFGLHVLEHIRVASVVGRPGSARQSAVQRDSQRQELGTGKRRILEHVATTSAQKRLKMPR